MLLGGFAIGLILGVFGTVIYCAYLDGVFDLDLSKPHDDYD